MYWFCIGYIWVWTFCLHYKHFLPDYFGIRARTPTNLSFILSIPPDSHHCAQISTYRWKMNIHLRKYNNKLVLYAIVYISINGVNSSNEDNAYSSESNSVKNCRIHRNRIYDEMWKLKKVNFSRAALIASQLWENTTQICGDFVLWDGEQNIYYFHIASFSKLFQL